MTVGAWRMAAAAMAWVAGVDAQFEPPTAQRGPKLDAVTAFPAPGTYSNTTGVALRAPDGAEIHYTLDGSKPTEISARVDAGQVLFIAGLYDGDRGLTTGYTIRAVATRAGRTDSDPATFSYTVARRDRTAYLTEDVGGGVRMIRDADNDKMFLTCGTQRCVLIDTGMGRGDLAGHVAGLAGGRPVTVIVTHMHGDHIGQAAQFIGRSTVLAGGADREAVATFLAARGVSAAALAADLKPVEDGNTLDLGGRVLEIHAVPGHTPGSIAILDTGTGDLFTGDTFGNNSPLPPDVMWLQFMRDPIDVYLANVRLARQTLDGRVRRILTGHNDRPLVGTAYLDNLQTAIQRGLDRGKTALIPSWRPAGTVQLVEGDRFADPNWFGVNVNPERWMPAPPDQLAGLTGLNVGGGGLSPRFAPGVYDYVVTRGRGALTLTAYPTSTRSRALRIAGRPAAAGVPVRVARATAATTVTVTAPDGTTTAEYRLTIR